MTERLLQFIWQFQYFNKGELATLQGESLLVIFPGHYNTNQGPDFLKQRSGLAVRPGRETSNCILKLLIGKNTIITGTTTTTT